MKISNNPLGLFFCFTYDSRHQVTGITDPAGHSIAIIPESDNSTTSPRTVTDREGNVTTTTYYDTHRIKDITLPGGEKTEFTYDSLGRIKKIHPTSYAAGKWIEYTYTDVSGQGTVKITGTYPDNIIERAWLNSRGDVIQTIDRNGRRTTSTYDANRRPLTVARWSGSYAATSEPFPADTPSSTAIITSCSYNATGDLVSVTDPNDRTTTFTYNALGDLETVIDADGVTQIENGYDLRNKLALTVGAIAGQEVSRVYDAAGRLTEITDPLQRTSSFTYDGDGLLATANSPADSATITLHDAVGTPSVIQDPLQQTIHPTHDKDSRPTALRNRRGKIYTTAYNLAGRVTTSATPLGFKTIVDSSTRGLVTKVTLSSGRTAENTAFDDEGRVLTQIIKDATGSVAATRNYTYMSGGPLLTVSETIGGVTKTTTRTYDDFYRLATYSDGEGNTIAYEYDKADNLTKLTYPDNTFVTYQYDVCNRLEKVTDWAGRETQYEYDDAGRLTTTTRPNGTVRTHMYDLTGQIRLIEERNASNDLIWLRACKYDLNGNIIETITSPTDTTNWSQPSDTLAYDDDNRLSTWNGDPVTHDADGNMITGPLPDGTTGIYNYDMHDRLISAGTVSYAYNPDGLRISDGNASYVIDPNGLSKPLGRTQGATATKYVWGLGLLYEEDSGGNIKTYHADHLGSTVALTNASGTVTDRWEYASYGTQTYYSGTSDTPFLFHGGLGCMTDSTGLVYMRARFYNPRVMRFLNADPIGFTGGMNWYVFVHNNPLTNVDPSGLLDGGAGNTLKGLQVPYVPINPQPSNPWLTESMSVKIAGPSIMVLGTGYKTEYLGGRNTGRLSGFDSPLGYQSGEVHESNYISAFQILGFTIRENHFVEEVIWTRDYARRYTTDRITWFPKSFESDLYGGFELKKGGSGVGAGSLRVSINKDGIGGTFTFFSLGVGFGPVNAFGVSIEENFKIRFNSQDVKINILRGSSNPLNLQQPNNTNKNCKE